LTASRQTAHKNEVDPYSLWKVQVNWCYCSLCEKNANMGCPWARHNRPTSIENNEGIFMFKFLGSVVGIIFIIGLLVVIGLFALIF